MRIAALVAALLFAVIPAAVAADSADAPPTVTIAYQPGLIFAGLIVMKNQHVLEQAFPGTKVEWKLLSNGAAVRDGLISGQLQIGCLGIAPFLIGWDRGAGYKLVASLNLVQSWLMVSDPKVKSLKDFTPDMKIALPGLDAIQAIDLRRGAEMQIGNAHALDANLVTLEHPLAMQALRSAQIAAHFSAPPFQYEEEANGSHAIFMTGSVMGIQSTTVVVATQKFYDQYPKFMAGFYQAVQNATKFVIAQPAKTAAILSSDAGGTPSAADFQKWLTRKDVLFATTPRGFLKHADFMKSIGLITKVPGSMNDIELPMLGGVGD